MAEEKHIDDADAIVYITPDNMHATITIKTVGNSYTAEQIIEKLKENGITRGIDTDAINQMLEHEVYNVPVCVANGKPPVDGEDGRFDFLCGIGVDNAEDDGIYKRASLFEAVREGQPLARYTPATNGKFGFNIKGQLVNPKKGRDLPPLKGMGITVSEDRMVYTAATGGRVVCSDGRIDISKVLIIDRDIDGTVGNIKFDGDVIIKGDILSGYSIECTGDLQVDGHVEKTNIKCANLLIKEGMQGGGLSKIEASGQVAGKFFEYVTIIAEGDVSANYIMNCDIESNGMVKTLGNKNSIIGGKVYALQGIVTSSLGNQSEVATHVSVGINKKLLEQYYETTKQIQKKEYERRTFKKAKDDLIAKYNQQQLQESEMFSKVTMALDVIEETLENLNANKEKFVEESSKTNLREICAKNTVYPNVSIYIDMNKYTIEAEMKSVRFKYVNNRIVAYKL